MRRRITKYVVIALLGALAGYVAYTYAQIARQAHMDETRQADVIIVFGAAEYVGKPSPVYKARLDHAVELYRRGVAAFIITTGGSGDSKFSEGGVGHDYVVNEGVPENNVIAETQGDDTRESSERVAIIMRANGLKTCVVVSDSYHIWRIKKLMAEQGIEAYGAPRPAIKPMGQFKRSLLYLREVLSITLWRLHIR